MDMRIFNFILPESGNIYGEKGGRVYSLIDSLNNVINHVPLNEKESYSVNFDTFRKNINNNVKKVTVKAVQSWNPNARACNLEVVSAETEIPENFNLEKLKNNNGTIKVVYENLQTKGTHINKKTIAFELKSMLDKEMIIKTEFKDALKELDKL